MNDATRKKLEAIELRQNNITTELEAIKDEEQDKFDNLPEGLQESEKGESMSEAISKLEDAISASNEVENALSDARE